MKMRDRLFWAGVTILCALILANTAGAQNPFTLYQFGANVDTNSGNKSAKTQRVTIATDQVQLTNALKVDGSGVTQPVSGTVTANQGGTWTVQPGNTANTTAWKVDGSAVTQPVSGTVTANMGTVTADPFGANADAASATGSISAKLRFIAGTGIPVTGTVTVGTHAVTQSGTWTVQPGNTANTTSWLVDAHLWNGAALASPDANNYPIFTRAATATSTAAASACNILSAASTNSTNCKGSAGNVYGFDVYNTTTTVYYLRLYNASSAPTCSSSTGFIRSIPVPPAASAGLVGGIVSNQIDGVNYATGVGYCLTGGSSSTDNTNAATGVFGEIRYK